MAKSKSSADVSVTYTNVTTAVTAVKASTTVTEPALNALGQYVIEKVLTQGDKSPLSN